MKGVERYLFLWGGNDLKSNRSHRSQTEPDTGAAWCSGYAAAWDAYPFDSNPYRENPYNDPDAAESWERGFREAEREIGEMNREPGMEALEILLPEPGKTYRQQPPGPNRENRWLFWGRPEEESKP